jgi:hypothetical protein
MRWRLLALLFLAVAAFGATARLYLKDGTYQIVREYQVMGDRVRYYSTERGDWEEIPLDLVDLDRTKKEVAEHAAEVAKEAKEQDQEDAAIRAQRQEIARIPVETGVYYIHGEKLEPLKAADVNIVNDKKRSVLKVLSPIPLVPGKTTVELSGAAAAFRITEDRPEFYFRLSTLESLAIIKLDAKKNKRIAENVSIMPVSNEAVEERQKVATFTREVGDQLYKIWPEKPLEPGEYAVTEYTEGSVTPQIWDFGIDAAK